MPHRLIQFFQFEHLPSGLKEISAHCRELALTADNLITESAEKTAGLRKLLEAKDCFVRAKLEERNRA